MPGFTVFLILLHAVTGGAASGAPMSVRPDCPSQHDNPVSREVIEMLLLSPAFEPDRLDHGVSSVSPASLRVLEDPRDSAICRQMREDILPGSYYDTPPWVSVMYEADGFYFMTAVRFPPDVHDVRINPDGTFSGTLEYHPVSVYNMRGEHLFTQLL